MVFFVCVYVMWVQRHWNFNEVIKIDNGMRWLPRCPKLMEPTIVYMLCIENTKNNSKNNVSHVGAKQETEKVQ